jgi:hypothetical protein
MGQKQANICDQAWLHLYQKCHLSIKTSNKQSLKQVISNCNRYFRDYFGSFWATIM